MATLTKVATKADIPTGSGKVVEVGGKTIAVFNDGGTFYAIDNTCLHQGGPLGEGELSGSSVTCPWHGWEYDVKTGACAMNPAVKVQTFPVQIQGDEIFVSL